MDLFKDLEAAAKAYRAQPWWRKLLDRVLWLRLRATLGRWAGTPWYYIRTHTYNRYHVVNVAGEGGYSWGWVDRDNLLLLACFKILRDYVEKEDPGVLTRTLDDYAYEGMGEDERGMLEAQVAREHEIRDLYLWWTKGRAVERADFDRRLEAWCAGEDVQNPMKENDRDQEMLERLVKVRQSLWT